MALRRPASMDLPRGPLDSPCVRNCCLDENDTCLGCGRTLDEILCWRESTDAEREAMRVLAAGRLAARRRR